MILLLIKNESPWTKDLQHFLAPYGVNVVQYRHPLKALDNLEELRPAIVLYDVQDFPRHWKILVKFLREEFTKEEVIFLLVSGQKVPLDEANKALFLGVNGILGDHGDGTALARNLREVFLRYGSFDIDAAPSDDPSSIDKPAPLPFLFRHPRHKHLVTGTLVRYDGKKATFRPDFAHEVADLGEGEILVGGSLRLEDRLVSFDSTILKNNGQLQLTIANN